ncbi:MAG TPA: ParB/RepB/Spo0J family partition protein [Candidatus Nanopelagicales bacterium]
MNQRRGLGRGLGALIPSRPDTESATVQQPAARDTVMASEAGSAAPRVGLREPVGATRDEDGDDLAPIGGVRYAELDLDAITANPRQPRTVFEPESLAELVHSIREIGLLQPIVVRPAPDAPGRYELVAGERRWRAGREAGLSVIPAIVRETTDDALLRDALLENLHRAQLNVLEEAAAYQQLLDDFGCTQDELASRIGRSRPQVSNTLRLLKLPPPVQRRVAAGVLSAGHARALLSLDDHDAMDRMAVRIVAEGLSVRSVEEMVMVGQVDGRERVRTPRPRGATAPGLVELAERLSDRLETRVRVETGKVKGKVTIEFATLQDLRRIVDVIEGGSGGDGQVR